MKILISLILSLSLPLTAAAAEPERDEDLWNSLIHLNQVYQSYRRDVLITIVPQVATVGATSVGVYYLAQYVRDLLKNGANASMVNQKRALGLILPSLVVQTAISGFLISRHTPAELSLTERYLLFIKNAELKALGDLSRLWERSLPEQYQIATESPELHQYLIDLDAWIKTHSSQGQPQPPTAFP